METNTARGEGEPGKTSIATKMAWRHKKDGEKKVLVPKKDILD